MSDDATTEVYKELTAKLQELSKQAAKMIADLTQSQPTEKKEE